MNVTLHLGDCLEYMKTLPAGSVDAVVTSPPYNLGGDFHSSQYGKPRLSFGAYNTYADNMPEDEYQAWQISILGEIFRVMGSGSVLFYNHKNRIKDGVTISPLEWLTKTNFLLKQIIVYDQGGTPNNDKIRFFPTHELIFVLSKSRETKLNNFQKYTDVWRIASRDNRAATGHPATFPVAIPKRCILSSTKTGDVVIDPFAGSGTTGVACMQTGRNFIGCEIDPTYFQIAKRRIELAQAQPLLFEGV